MPLRFRGPAERNGDLHVTSTNFDELPRLKRREKRSGGDHLPDAPIREEVIGHPWWVGAELKMGVTTGLICQSRRGDLTSSSGGATICTGARTMASDRGLRMASERLCSKVLAGRDGIDTASNHNRFVSMEAGTTGTCR